METSIITINNSKYIILPDSYLDQLGITNKVNIELEDNNIIITPAKKQVRAGWAEAFTRIKNDGNSNDEILECLDTHLMDDWKA